MFQTISAMEKSLWVRGGGIAIFRREILSLIAEKLRGVPSFNDIEILGYRKFLCLIGVVTIFRRVFIVSVAKNIAG